MKVKVKVIPTASAPKPTPTPTPTTAPAAAPKAPLPNSPETPTPQLTLKERMALLSASSGGSPPKPFQPPHFASPLALSRDDSDSSSPSVSSLRSQLGGSLNAMNMNAMLAGRDPSFKGRSATTDGYHSRPSRVSTAGSEGGELQHVERASMPSRRKKTRAKFSSVSE